MMSIDGKEIVLRGRLIRCAALRAEYFEHVDDVAEFLGNLANARVTPDLFTFVQDVSDATPRHAFHQEWDTLAVVAITTYDEWWKRQINGKTRNMIRKAEKCGVVVRVTPFDDKLVKGIQGIYNESPLRQGKPFAHFGRDCEWLKRAHATYLDQSEFVGAYSGDELIGFVKLFHRNGFSSLMQVIAKISSREKAPTNALIAKAVERCAAQGVQQLHYGVWSRRSLGEFKKHHGFEPYRLPRYYVPLTATGKLALALGLHRRLGDRLPISWQDRLIETRARYYARKYRHQSCYE
jgi:hypothetical protein